MVSQVQYSPVDHGTVFVQRIRELLFVGPGLAFSVLVDDGLVLVLGVRILTGLPWGHVPAGQHGKDGQYLLRVDLEELPGGVDPVGSEDGVEGALDSLASWSSICLAATHSKGSGTPVVYRSLILRRTSSLSVIPIFTSPGMAWLVRA